MYRRKRSLEVSLSLYFCFITLYFSICIYDRTRTMLEDLFLRFDPIGILEHERSAAMLSEIIMNVFFLYVSSSYTYLFLIRIFFAYLAILVYKITNKQNKNYIFHIIAKNASFSFVSLNPIP